MVKGLGQFRGKMRAIPDKVRAEVVATMEDTADEIVKTIRALRPVNEIEINWTWGDAPKGSVTVGKVGKNQYDQIAITIYARGDTFAAGWFEFGTAPRVQKTTGRRTGQITAQPFFFPVYRANRRLIRQRISRAVTRGFKKA